VQIRQGIQSSDTELINLDFSVEYEKSPFTLRQAQGERRFFILN
jgi:hypothetical protein